MKIVKTYEDKNCKEFDIFVNDVKVSYYIEHYNNPITEEKLDNTVFEMYYNYDEEFEEFLSSVICDSLEECLEYL